MLLLGSSPVWGSPPGDPIQGSAPWKTREVGGGLVRRAGLCETVIRFLLMSGEAPVKRKLNGGSAIVTCGACDSALTHEMRGGGGV